MCWVKPSQQKPGPDLSVEVGGERWYVECYVLHKSFSLLEFLQEVLSKIDHALGTSYDLCLPLELPRNSEVTRFLDKILTPFLDPSYLAKAKQAAMKEYPVVLYKHPGSSLHIYVEGDDAGAYCPGRIPDTAGDPKSYVEQALKEAVNAKICSNDLKHHHPNLLAVNYLLSPDFQLAESLPERMQSLTLPQISPNIDVLAVSAVGIDARLKRDQFKVAILAGDVDLRSLGEIATNSRHDPSGQ